MNGNHRQAQACFCTRPSRHATRPLPGPRAQDPFLLLASALWTLAMLAKAADTTKALTAAHSCTLRSCIYCEPAGAKPRAMRSALLLSIASAAASRVTKDQWQTEAQAALEEAKPLYAQATSGCVLTISGNRVTTTSDSPLRLCRVDHGGDVGRAGVERVEQELLHGARECRKRRRRAEEARLRDRQPPHNHRPDGARVQPAWRVSGSKRITFAHHFPVQQGS